MAPIRRLTARALADLLPELSAFPAPVYLALARSVVALVLDGRIADGVRLPSERDLAAGLGLSRATVTAAYDQLRADGYLDSRVGSGSFTVIPRSHNIVPERSAPRVDADVIDLTRATLSAPPGVVESAVASVVPALTPHLLGDGYHPAGLPGLRAAIATSYVARGVPTDPDQILVTNGALSGLDLLLRSMASVGDQVITELPSYPGALDAIRAHGARIVPVAQHPGGGWHTDHLVAALRQSAARLAYLVPDFHNPTGALVPDEDRRAVLREARRLGVTVLVDETFAELGFVEPATPMARLDSSVISIGSLSKTVWGGLRIGWLRGSVDLVTRLARLRTSVDLGGAVIDQAVATSLMPHLDAMARSRRELLAERRDALLVAVGRHLPEWRVTTTPQGGLSAWFELPQPLSTPLALLAGHRGVVLVPGSRFGVDGTLERFVRLPFALPAEVTEQAVQRIAAAWAPLATDGSTGSRTAAGMVVA